MRIAPTEIPDVLVIDPVVVRDDRGFFVETYRADRYRRHGITATFVQDNHSMSGERTLRGLHLQRHKPQAKLIRVTEGEVFDVAVDVRRGSPHFLRWVAVTLSAGNFKQCYIPPGFAHGFCVMSHVAQVEYKCSEVYDPSDEIGIAWNDPRLQIAWPLGDPVLSPRDRGNPSLDEQMDLLPLYVPDL